MTNHPTRPDPEALLGQMGRLRDLAGSLVWEWDGAEDLVQEALLVAMQKPPHRSQALGTWLGKVVRSLASDAGRRRSRRRAREEVAARPEAVPAAARVAERREVLARVLAAMEELPEPVGVAIHLRYLEGLPPREIARRVQAPLATVKARLKRGLARLRLRLDTDHGGSRKAWFQVLLPLAGVPSRGIEAGTGASLVGAGRFLLMAAKPKLFLVSGGLLLAALSLLGIWMSPAVEVPAGAIKDREPLGTLPGDPLAVRPAPIPPPGNGITRELSQTPPLDPAGPADSTPAPPPTGWEVIAVDRASGRPLADVEIEVHGEGEGSGCEIIQSQLWDRVISMRTPSRKFKVNPAGKVVIPMRLRPGVMISARSQEGLRAFLEIGKETKPPIKLLMRPEKVLTILTRDSRGKPVAGVPIVVSGNPRSNHPCVTSFGKEGKIVIPDCDWFARNIVWGTGRLQGRLRIPLAEPLIFPLDCQKTSTVKVTLPPTGRIVVGLPDEPAGGPGAEYRIALVVRPDNALLAPEAWKQAWDTAREVKEGQAVFPHVGLDLYLSIIAYKGTDRDHSIHITREVEGPKQPGRTLHFDMSF